VEDLIQISITIQVLRQPTDVQGVRPRSG